MSNGTPEPSAVGGSGENDTTEIEEIPLMLCKEGFTCGSQMEHAYYGKQSGKRRQDCNQADMLLLLF